MRPPRFIRGTPAAGTCDRAFLGVPRPIMDTQATAAIMPRGFDRDSVIAYTDGDGRHKGTKHPKAKQENPNGGGPNYECTPAEAGLQEPPAPEMV